MKSGIWCACVVAMLLVSTVSFGVIMEDTGWSKHEVGLGFASGYYGGSAADADADEDNLCSSASADGYQGFYTTVAGWFHWEYYLYTYAKAEIWLEDFEGYPAAYAYSHAHGMAYINGWTNLTSEAYVDYSDYSGDPHVKATDNDGGNDGVYSSNYTSMPIGEGVGTDHSVVVGAWIYSEDTGDNASSHVCVDAWCDMWQ